MNHVHRIKAPAELKFIAKVWRPESGAIDESTDVRDHGIDAFFLSPERRETGVSSSFHNRFNTTLDNANNSIEAE